MPERAGEPSELMLRVKGDALIDGLFSLENRDGEPSDKNARLGLALESRWGRLARPLFASEEVDDCARRGLQGKSERWNMPHERV